MRSSCKKASDKSAQWAVCHCVDSFLSFCVPFAFFYYLYLSWIDCLFYLLLVFQSEAECLLCPNQERTSFASG